MRARYPPGNVGGNGPPVPPDAFVGERASGPHPLASGFGLTEFRIVPEGRRGTVRGTLMNQEVRAGMGNEARRRAWVGEDDLALLTDQYQLTMMQAYWREEMHADAVFSLFVRRLPPGRNFLLAAGLEQVLTSLEALCFRGEDLDYLRTLGDFRDDFLDWLAELRFTGSVHAPPEGTPLFPEEPILEVTAPIAEAQLVETLVMNQVHLQTVLASKAARVVLAADGRSVVDFGLRRMHGADAGLKSARAFHIAGVSSTSHVLAGKVWGVPVTGTMAHSYVQAHDSEEAAFRAFTALYPDTILLVDTYDTLDGVRRVVDLAEELGEDFRVRGIRLDSGDLGELAKESRRILDGAGLEGVRIFASGGLDEHEIARLVEDGAPIDGFGVGTGMGVAKDAPSLDMAYKLTAYGGRGRMKLSPGKRIFPGRKQVFRVEEDGRAVRDVLARADEEAVGKGLDGPDERSATPAGDERRSSGPRGAGSGGGVRPGRPLLREVMRNGRIVDGAVEDLEAIRERARDEIGRLPDRIRALEDADPPYPVEVSAALSAHQGEIESWIEDEVAE